jgi:hypothetical protein
MILKKVNIGLNQPAMHVVQLIVVIIQHSTRQIVRTIRIAIHTILHFLKKRFHLIHLKIHQQQTNHPIFKFVVCSYETLKAPINYFNKYKMSLNIPNLSLHSISQKEKKKTHNNKKARKKKHTVQNTEQRKNPIAYEVFIFFEYLCTY